MIKNIYTSSETKTNLQLGGEYWVQSHDLHMKEDELAPPIDDGPNRAVVNRRVRNMDTITLDEDFEQQFDLNEPMEYGGG